MPKQPTAMAAAITPRPRADGCRLAIQVSTDDSAFLQHVGPVDLSADMGRMIRAPRGTILEYLPHPWQVRGKLGPIYLDPLQVLGDGLPNWRAPNGRRVPGAVGYVDVCADTIQKAGFSGGGATAFEVPARRPDPELVNDDPVWPNGLRFSEMVRQSMAWFGLPGLRRLPALPPPLQDLQDEFAERYGH